MIKPARPDRTQEAGEVAKRRSVVGAHRTTNGAGTSAAILTERDIEEVRKRKPAVTADDLASSLKQAVTQIIEHAPTNNNHSQTPVASGSS